MIVTIRKWGNSAAVRLPARVLQQAHLSLGQELEIRVEGGKVVLEPVVCKEYDINELVAGITDDNKHVEVACRNIVGKEV